VVDILIHQVIESDKEDIDLELIVLKYTRLLRV